MGREFSGKLTADDLEYLRQRHTNAYVDRMIELHGVTKRASGDPDAERIAAEQAAAEAKAKAEAEEAAEKAKEAQGGSGGGEDEDLIGFNVLKATEAEVSEHLAALEGDPLEAEKARLLSAESAREDREPRKGVVALLQPAE